MKPASAVARRYAKALASLAREADRLEPVGEELATFERALDAEPTLGEVLRRPWVQGALKRRLVGEVAAHLGLSPLAHNFLALLAQRRRMALLPEVRTAYRALVDEAAGRVRARVRSAAPLGEAERAAIAGALGRRLGKAVQVDAEVDPALLGGFVAEVGSQVWDASLTGRLGALRERFIQESRGTA